MKKYAASLALAWSLWLVSGASAEVFRDETRHFSITSPAGWRRIPDEELRAMQRAARVAGEQPQWLAGYRQADRALEGAPYFIVQYKAAGRLSGASYRQIENALKTELAAPLKEVKERIQNWATDLELGQPVLDRERGQIRLRIAMNVLGQPIEGISVWHLANEGILFVNGYAPKDNMPKMLPLFQEVNDSVRIDPGHEFKPRLGVLDNLSPGVRGGIIGGVVGGLAAGVYALFWRRKKTEATGQPA